MSASSTNARSTNRIHPVSLSVRGLTARPEGHATFAGTRRGSPICVESLPGQDTLRRLQHVRGYPAVSLLLSTVPADRLTGPDAAMLARLAVEAEHRVRAECGATEAAELRSRLRWLTHHIAASETDQALGVFIQSHHTEIVRLPTLVRDRVVVAETFATGDLVTALRHAPRYLLLVLGEEATSLYDGSGRRLEGRADDHFPVVNHWRGGLDPLPVGYDIGASMARSARQRAYLRRVDDALDGAAAGSDLPVVLAGPRRLTTAFLVTTAQAERVVGTTRSGDTGLDVLGRLAHRVIQNHTAREEQKALAALTVAHARGRVATGMADVWPAVLRAAGQTLLVEEPCTYPARLTGDGLGLRPAPPEGGRRVVADVIGELAWAVTFYGGNLIVVPEGTLGGGERIALILAGEPTTELTEA